MALETDPIDILLDEDGDLDMSTGGPVFSYGVPAVEQGMKISLQIFRGECIYDRELGVPWVENDFVTENQALLGFAFNKLKVLTEMRKAILAAPHDVEVTQLSCELDGATRNLSATIGLKTQFGDTEITISQGDL